MIEHEKADVVIIGAGPAGMAAALRASAEGLSVIVFDEQAQVGGQIFRQSPKTFGKTASPAYRLYPFGKKLVADSEANTSIDWRFRQTVWGLFPSPDGIKVCSGTSSVLARAVIVASGAYEMPVAFPGWTKPGVMGVGAIQTLVKSQHILPGQKFILAGSHPLLLLVGDLLCEAGAEVLEIAIARSRPGFRELLQGLPALPGNISIFKESGRALANLLRRRVPIRFGRMIVAADGPESGIQNVTLADCDADWNITGGHQRYETDILGIGYGLLASTELCRQIGCDMRWQPRDGGWIVSHDGFMRSSISGVYVAGEPAGIRGAASAAAEGEMAALSVIADLKPTQQSLAEISRMSKKITATRRFSDRVASFFASPLDRLAELAQDDTIVCRCEDISAKTVTDFLDENPHASNVNSVKLACRTGMGFCQGRYCNHTIAQIVARKRDMAPEQCGQFTGRIPVKPVTLGTLAGSGS